MGEVQQGSVEPDRHGHNYLHGHRSRDGYAVCGKCGVQENVAGAAETCGFDLLFTLRAEVERLTGFINDSRDMVVIDRSSRCEAAEADAKDADRERKRCEISHAEVNIVLDKAIARAEKAERERDEARESFDKAASAFRTLAARLRDDR